MTSLYHKSLKPLHNKLSTTVTSDCGTKIRYSTLLFLLVFVTTMIFQDILIISTN